jgi:hypothetical protein
VVTVTGGRHTLLVPIGHAALYFNEPEPERELGFEIEP